MFINGCIILGRCLIDAGIQNGAKNNFKSLKGNLTINDLNIVSSQRDIDNLRSYLINEIEMNTKKVENTLKKFHNNYKSIF